MLSSLKFHNKEVIQEQFESVSDYTYSGFHTLDNCCGYFSLLGESNE